MQCKTCCSRLFDYINFTHPYRGGDNKPDFLIDISTAGAIALLIAVVLAGFGAAIGISEEKTWRIMSW